MPESIDRFSALGRNYMYHYCKNNNMESEIYKLNLNLQDTKNSSSIYSEFVIILQGTRFKSSWDDFAAAVAKSH